MLLSLLILLPLLGTLVLFVFYTNKDNEKPMKTTALLITVADLFISLII
jgi:NADH:ubiquinone oxidoreductase subunit 4 (subunit M)